MRGASAEVMPKVGSQQTLARQWEILQLIPARGAGITAIELTNALAGQGFVVTKRTVERDLQELSHSFGLVCNDKSKPYGWRWIEGAGHALPSPTIAEAVSVNILERQVKHLLPDALLRVLEPRFTQARRKLEALNTTNSVTRWTDKIRVHSPGIPLLPPVMNENHLESIQNAVLNEYQLQADYRPAKSQEAQSLTLHPLGLVQRGPVLYLLATAFKYTDIRLYAVHRFKSAEMLAERATVPQGFSIDQVIDSGALEFGAGNKIALTARIHESIERFLIETPLSSDMVIMGQGEWVVVTATVTDTWQLRWWILSQGAGIEVLSPESLRKEIAETLAATHCLYQEHG